MAHGLNGFAQILNHYNLLAGVVKFLSIKQKKIICVNQFKFVQSVGNFFNDKRQHLLAFKNF